MPDHVRHSLTDGDRESQHRDQSAAPSNVSPMQQESRRPESESSLTGGDPAAHQHVQRQVTDLIGRKEERRLRAQEQTHRTVWFGLGMFGLVGWSVAIPTLLGAAIGLWIDARWDGQQSWTLMLIVGGLTLGCLNAWRWLRDESEVR